jgi:hypothetical protein
MHRRHRRDATQSPAVAELIAMGFSVADTSQCGDDFPDLVIGKHGLTGLVELKAKSPGRTTMNKLVSAGQREFAATWRGSPVIFGFCAEDVRVGFDAELRRVGILK